MNDKQSQTAPRPTHADDSIDDAKTPANPLQANTDREQQYAILQELWSKTTTPKSLYDEYRTARYNDPIQRTKTAKSQYEIIQAADQQASDSDRAMVAHLTDKLLEFSYRIDVMIYQKYRDAIRDNGCIYNDNKASILGKFIEHDLDRGETRHIDADDQEIDRKNAEFYENWCRHNATETGKPVSPYQLCRARQMKHAWGEVAGDSTLCEKCAHTIIETVNDWTQTQRQPSQDTSETDDDLLRHDDPDQLCMSSYCSTCGASLSYDIDEESIAEILNEYLGTPDVERITDPINHDGRINSHATYWLYDISRLASYGATLSPAFVDLVSLISDLITVSRAEHLLERLEQGERPDQTPA